MRRVKGHSFLVFLYTHAINCELPWPYAMRESCRDICGGMKVRVVLPAAAGLARRRDKIKYQHFLGKHELQCSAGGSE